MSKTKLIVRESDSGWSNYFCYLKTARLYPIFGDPFLVNSEEPDFYNSLMNDRYGVETKNLYKNFQIFVKKQINGLNLEVVKWKNNKTSYEFWVYKKGYLLYAYFDTFNYGVPFSFDSIEAPQGFIIGPTDKIGQQTKIPIRVPIAVVGKELCRIGHMLAYYDNKKWAGTYNDEDFAWRSGETNIERLYNKYPLYTNLKRIRDIR